LCKKGFVLSETAALRKISDKTRRIVTLSVSAEEAMSLAEAKRKSAPLRYEVLKLLSAEGSASASDLFYFTGASTQTLRSLEKSGIVTFSEEEQLRIAPPAPALPAVPIVLNEEQEAAFSGILALTESGKPEVALLQGITGSGKTPVYLRLVQELLARGKNAIVLVPEIVLTPQMMSKFSSYFGGEVAMLH
ncbi:MAG: DEAD/DEAH box helicase family protein, partial [Ruthenibacterium sp.]